MTAELVTLIQFLMFVRTAGNEWKTIQWLCITKSADEAVGPLLALGDLSLLVVKRIYVAVFVNALFTSFSLSSFFSDISTKIPFKHRCIFLFSSLYSWTAQRALHLKKKKICLQQWFLDSPPPSVRDISVGGATNCGWLPFISN